MQRTKEFAEQRGVDAGPVRIFVNLPAVVYWSLLGSVVMLVGNSSSGIMEAASFGLPVVNVGMRQQGRERARNVIDAEANSESIAAAMAKARDAEFRESLRGMTNPYGDGHAAETIAQLLGSVPLDGLLVKAPAPLPETEE
jgi:UDP-N-acetylglucosamine 2-epimerase (non-hydrolysing)/GDP/UDP-N,N'-diacetylbacillosamine 2-epimerase (hydrolysing)